jgi:hypothetical protein
VALAPGDPNVWWVISETSIASVGSTTGVATGIAEGSATVRFDFLWGGKWLSSWGALPSYPITVGYTLNLSVDRNVGSVSWPYSGFILQENSDLGNPLGWTDVPGGAVSPVTISIPSSAGAKFYRLKTSP